jgi:hypothetical protein
MASPTNNGAGLDPVVHVALFAGLVEQLDDLEHQLDRLPDNSAGLAALGVQVTALAGQTAELQSEVRGLTKTAQNRIDHQFLAALVARILEPELQALRADLAIVRVEVNSLNRKVKRWR